MDNCVARQLRGVEQKYKGRHTYTGQVVISDMARDAAVEIERLESGIKDIGKECAKRYDRIKVLEKELADLKSDIEAGRLVRFYSANEIPPTEDVDTCLVIVEHVHTKTRHVQFTEFRFGEWDIANIWNLIAWAEYPDLTFAAMEEDAHG